MGKTCSNLSFVKEIIMEIEWINGFEIKSAIGSDELVISANKEGLLSLAKHLTALADGVPGDHIHYDVHNSLEEGSADLIIEKALPEDNDPDEDIHDPCLRFQR